MTIFKLPDLGEGLPDAEIREWYVHEGDEVKFDQPLVAMETAKAVVDVPSPFAGHIVKLYGHAGDVIHTGAPLIEFKVDSGTIVGVIETTDVLLEEAPTGVTTHTTQIKAAPSVRALAKKLNIDLSKVQGTGAHGSITTDDVTRAIPTNEPQVLGEPLHGARRAMAQQMAKSHQVVVPVTLTEDADLHRWPDKNDMTTRLIFAIVAAAKTEPTMNAHFYGESLSYARYTEVNIGIAVDTPAGLYVPVLKQAEQKSATEIRQMLESFKQKALSQSFAPEDLQGATISLSNFGTITGRYASPVIVPPTVAIIGVGRSRDTVVAYDGKPAIHPMMPLSLTFDHRAATGGEAARFLAALITALEHA